MSSSTVGGRVAAYRRRRGLSQAALAGLVGRSESWLSQVERGLRHVDRLSVLMEMARVLHVDLAALTGESSKHAPNGHQVANGLVNLRRAVTKYDVLAGAAPSASAPQITLHDQAAETHRLYQAADYDQVIERLPGLLAEVEGAICAPGPYTERDARLAHVSAYVVAAKLASKLGAADLAMLFADRAANCAIEAGSVVARGMAGYQVVCALLQADQPEEAEQLAVRLAEHLDRSRADTDDPAVLSLAGALWLVAAVLAARRTHVEAAWLRLARAEELATLLGVEGNHAWTAFGPTNVAVHRVSVAAELGDAGAALRAARDVNPARLPSGLLSRRAQVHLDLARAQARRRRDAEATLNLLEAERIAPEVIRHNVIAQEVVWSVLVRATRRDSARTALVGLAARAGLME